MPKSRIKPRDSRNIFRKAGGWWVDIQINGRRIREFAGRTEAKARDYRDALKAWGREGRLGLDANRPEGEPVTFEAFADDYLETYAKQKRSYSRDAISIAHLKRFFAGYMLKDVNAEAVARYRASRDKKSVSTVNRELACLRTALRKAVEWGRLTAYPLPKDKLLRKEPEFKPRILEPAESRRLIAAANPRWLRPAIIVWLNTGLRKMELLKLRREDVDLMKRRLTVRAENAKNGKARTLPINELVAETLRAMPGGAYFFENPETKTHLRDLLEPFRAALTKAKISGRVRIHDLRDTFATLALRGGIDIRTVAEILGDTPEVALKRYCHTDEKTMREAVELISALTLGSRHKVHEGRLEDMEPATKSVC